MGSNLSLVAGGSFLIYRVVMHVQLASTRMQVLLILAYLDQRLGWGGCANCDPGRFSYSGWSLLSSLISSQFRDRCDCCPAGKYSGAGWYKDLISYLLSLKRGGCSDCAAGQYSSGCAGGCTNCPAGQYSSGTGWGGCNTCAAGQVKSCLAFSG